MEFTNDKIFPFLNDESSINEQTNLVKLEVKCQYCNYKTTNSNYLNQHEGHHTSAKKFKCRSCDFKTNYKDNLNLHESSHTAESEFEFSLYDYSKPNRMFNLEVRQVMVNKDERMRCRHCDYKTSSNLYLKQHELTHLRKMEFKCGFCGLSNSRLVLNLNEMVKCNEVVKCMYCGYKTFNIRNPKQHEITKTGDIEYKCMFCKFKAEEKSILKQHEGKHFGQCQQCQKCDYKTWNRRFLKQHEKYHTKKE